MQHLSTMLTQDYVCCCEQVLETVPDLSPMADEEGYFAAGKRSGSRSRRRTASACSDDGARPPAPIAENEAEAEADEGETHLHPLFFCRTAVYAGRVEEQHCFTSAHCMLQCCCLFSPCSVFGSSCSCDVVL